MERSSEILSHLYNSFNALLILKAAKSFFKNFAIEPFLYFIVHIVNDPEHSNF